MAVPPVITLLDRLHWYPDTSLGVPFRALLLFIVGSIAFVAAPIMVVVNLALHLGEEGFGLDYPRILGWWVAFPLVLWALLVYLPYSIWSGEVLLPTCLPWGF